MRRHDERGAVVPLVAVMLTVLIGITALTVDIGMQRVARTDMQTLADMVALDLARELDGRAASAIEPDLQAAADRSLARNPDVSGDNITVAPELGTLADDGTFTVAAGATVPDAVRVTASTTVPFHFTSGSGGASRSAVGVARAQACYKLGSWAARLSTSDDANVLYQALAAHGIGAGVSAATYQALADAHVDAADLATQLGLASPEELGTASVTLSELVDATAQLLGTNGASAGQVTALNTLSANLATLGDQPIGLANLFTVESGAGAGLDAELNVADLVTGAILVADGNNAVDVPGLTAGVGDLTSASSSLTLVQGARAACGFAGGTPNQSNQVTLDTSAELAGGLTVPTSLVTSIANLADIEVASPLNDPVTLAVSSAQATSTLDAITCGADSRSVLVTTTGGLLSATLTVPVSVTLDFLLGILPVTITGTITAEVSSSGAVTAVTITVPTDAYDTPYSDGGDQLQLPAAQVQGSSISAGSLTLAQATDVLDAVATSIVDPMVDELNATVIGPLSDLVGLRTAGADVLLLDHPSCTTPALRG